MDEDALMIPEFDSTFYFEKLFQELKGSGIFSMSKNYRNLHHYSRVYILRRDRIVEEGNPLNLVDHRNSVLYKILVEDDIRTVRTLENKIEKNQEKFLKFLNDNLFNITTVDHD